MVTVYIWSPTSFGRISESNFCFETKYVRDEWINNRAISSKTENQKKSWEVTSIPQNLPKQGLLARSVGHASMHLLNNEYDIYFSLYPNTNGKDIELVRRFKTPFKSKFSIDYDADIDEIKSYATAQIQLFNLDEDSIGRSIEWVNKKYDSYILCGKNCSNLVMDLLQTGSSKQEKSLLSSLKTIYSGASTILQTFSAISEISSGNINRKFAFEPARSFNAIHQMCGGQTPETVFNFAKFLKTKIG